MKILLADQLSKACLQALEQAGHSVEVDSSLKDAALVEALRERNPHVLVVRSTKVPEAAVAASKNLELIVRAGAGFDTIDVDAASRSGVFVANCPGKNATAVAELTMGLLLALDRSLPDNVSEARAGHWNKKGFSAARGLKGRTLGIIGIGNIGRVVITRARAFDMRVVAWSRSLTDEEAALLGVTRMGGPLEVATVSDAVSLHVAATPETKALAGRAFFEAMKPGAFFINTTRGAVVDEDALLWAMKEKGIRCALDVFSNEPAHKEGPFEHPLASHPQVYLSHHIGASTEQAQDAIAEEAVRIVLTFAATGKVPNCVNIAEQSPATHQLTVRHLDKVGVLAAVLDIISKAGWNVQEMENMIFAGAQAACANIRFDGAVESSVVNKISAHPDVVAVTLIDL